MKTHSSSWLINKYIIDKKTFFTLPYLKFIKNLYKEREGEKKTNAYYRTGRGLNKKCGKNICLFYGS